MARHTQRVTLVCLDLQSVPFRDFASNAAVAVNIQRLVQMLPTMLLVCHPAVRANKPVTLAHGTLDAVDCLMARLAHRDGAVLGVWTAAGETDELGTMNVQGPPEPLLVIRCGHAASGAALVVALTDGFLD
jgi:hypothetical protein